jgi:fructokinase
VQLDDQGKASYEFLEDTAWDNLEWVDSLANLAPQADAVCFGTLGQRSARSRETIQRFVATLPSEALKIFDINIRAPFYTRETILQSLELANVLKLNDDELPILAELVDPCPAQVDVLRQLAERFALRCVALTRGDQGALLLRGEEVSDMPGVSTKVVDTVGAGDAFTAALAVGLLNSDPLDQLNQRAAQLAAYVCSQAGATPFIPERYWF